tara:strand:+ start:65 stop:262 length:198 start_codon:yes stop_codon:yes gene_type:complete
LPILLLFRILWGKPLLLNLEARELLLFPKKVFLQDGRMTNGSIMVGPGYNNRGVPEWKAAIQNRG